MTGVFVTGVFVTGVFVTGVFVTVVFVTVVFVAAGLPWYRIFRDSGGYLDLCYAAIQTERPLRRKD